MVCGGFCVRLVSRVDLRGAAPHWSISWCSMTPRCGKVHTQSVLVLNLFSLKFYKLFDKFVTAGARNIYHQLLMNSLLMDLKYKKIFAVQFAKVTQLKNTYIFYIPLLLATKLCHHHQCADQYVWSVTNNLISPMTHVPDWCLEEYVCLWSTHLQIHLIYSPMIDCCNDQQRHLLNDLWCHAQRGHLWYTYISSFTYCKAVILPGQ